MNQPLPYLYLCMLRHLITAICLFISVFVHADTITVDYDGFSVTLDCDRRAAIRFEYTANADHGNLPRKHSFKIDPNVPERCQQTATRSYKHLQYRYDRGHLVPANHLDHLDKGIAQSNYMTNITPQAANMNRGAWLLTEEITECYRDIEPLKVIGGVIWGDDTSDDYFVESHGVATPDAFWKALIASDRMIAWIVPNNSAATRKRLNDYLVSLEHIEGITGEEFDVEDGLKGVVPSTSWALPKGCDKG